MALPNAVFAMLMHTYLQYDRDGLDILNMNGVNVLWAGYTSVLGFLIVFRNNQAYTRFWEGTTLIHEVRGEWFNAASSLFAFCNRDEERKPEVKAFQHTVIRLFSMLYCSALQQICCLDDDCFEIIETQCLDAESLDFMREANDRCEILVQWLQRLIRDSADADVLKVPAPLLTRAFQELSRGIVNLNNVRKIKEIPFPFPYAQLISVMLMVHWVTTPIVASQLMASPAAAGVCSFALTFAVWSLIYITMEIDQPFGDDANDLPLHEMQRDFNHSLLTLMHPLAQRFPRYTPNAAAQRRAFGMKPSLTKTLEVIEKTGNERLEDEHFQAVISSCSETAFSLRNSRRSQYRESLRPRDSSMTNGRGWFGFGLRQSGEFGFKLSGIRRSGSRASTGSSRASTGSRGSIRSLAEAATAAGTPPEPRLSRSSQVSIGSPTEARGSAQESSRRASDTSAGDPDGELEPDPVRQPKARSISVRLDASAGDPDGQSVGEEGCFPVPTAPEYGKRISATCMSSSDNSERERAI